MHPLVKWLPPHYAHLSYEENWKRGWDLNPRPPGYEPDELTGLLYPASREGLRLKGL